MIKVKNHQIPPTIRVDRALGISSEPGSIVMEDKRLKNSLKGFKTSVCYNQYCTTRMVKSAVCMCVLYVDAILKKHLYSSKAKSNTPVRINCWIHTRTPIGFSSQS